MKLRNKLTTVCGAGSGLPILIEGIQSNDWHKIISGTALILFGLFAKDFNVSGTGTPRP